MLFHDRIQSSLLVVKNSTDSGFVYCHTDVIFHLALQVLLWQELLVKQCLVIAYLVIL